MPLPMPRIARESPDALIDRCRRFSSDSEVVQDPPEESLFKDRYFVSGIGTGIAKRFKEPALQWYGHNCFADLEILFNQLLHT